MRLPSYQELTKEQDEVLRCAQSGRWLITGPPGSGKTVIALYLARRLTEMRRSSVLVMYGKPLSRYVAQAVTALGIDGSVRTFHSYFTEFVRRQWSCKPPGSGYAFDWAEIMRLQLDDPAPRGSLPRLLVDEGQDLPEMFFGFARLLSPHLVVFADENQTITDDNSTLQELRATIKPDGELSLTANLRNTAPIAEVAAHFFTDVETGLTERPTTGGPQPTTHSHATRDGSITQITNYATTYRDRQIGVFVPFKRQVVEYADALERRGVPVSYYVSNGDAPPIDFARPGVTVMTWQSAKGLEFDSVFIAEMQAWNGDVAGKRIRMLLYVLASRARRELFFVWSGVGRPPIADLLPKRCLDTVA